MFDDAQPQLEKILALVSACPEKLQEKCFELLLTSYLQTLAPSRREPHANEKRPADPPAPEIQPAATKLIPEAIKTRFNSLVNRTQTSTEKAAELFDFNVDPFTFHALSVPGSSTSEKMKNLALLLALKGYLTSATWVADWKEFRAACIDHNCWDQGNSGKVMKHQWFKAASLATDISLSSDGIKAAEACFAKLAGNASDASA